ncbi:hypothetical protein [Antricoccus suffuscus]|uniref:hypothetical protein n=1 Tax=Antricoccus suffuscus TaxID=1629062 RepID=UPI001474D3E7|nr:hypothetical protein [Antricoccus suffuscus]
MTGPPPRSLRASYEALSSSNWPGTVIDGHTVAQSATSGGNTRTIDFLRRALKRAAD